MLGELDSFDLHLVQSLYLHQTVGVTAVGYFGMPSRIRHQTRPRQFPRTGAARARVPPVRRAMLG